MFSFKLGSSIQLGKYELGGSCGCLNCTKCHCYRGCIYMTRTKLAPLTSTTQKITSL